MTREEKDKKLALCLNRVKRLTVLAEVVNTWNELDTTMSLAFRVVFTSVEANRIASQPTDDMVCVGGFDSGGKKIV